LEKQPTVEVVGEASDGATTVELVRERSPDVVIMDIEMEDMDGIEATRRIVEDAPDVKVIALSMHSERPLVREMLKAGAWGYLLKDCAFEELAQAIEAVVAERSYLSPNIASIVLEDYRQEGTAGELSVYSVLTAREREVLQSVAEGLTTKETAARMHLSVKTVEKHRRSIMEKLDMYSLAELTKYAVRQGLTSLDP
jgi:DNA-binding NarL/FixJ family response regulator